MAHDLRCPSCGHENTAEATSCTNCHFPLHDGAPQPLAGGSAPEAAPAAPAKAPEPPAEVKVEMHRIRPIRPRRPASADQQLQTQLIVGLGGAAVVIGILWVAYSGFKKNNTPAEAPVAGASAQQLADIELERNQLRADSTNINAQISLANVLYDTANWSEAIIHYKSAMRMDPTRVTTVVDMGVCYYNLSDVPTAETLFKKALEMDPRQPIALFNLGIVAENRGETEQALSFYHRAQEAGPPAGLGEALKAGIQRVQEKQKTAGAGGKPPAASPGGGF